MVSNIKFVPKKWGYERWIVNNDLYCCKELFVAQGHGCSIHYHKNKFETFYIKKGMISLLLLKDVESIRTEYADGYTSPLSLRDILPYDIWVEKGYGCNFQLLKAKNSDPVDIPRNSPHMFYAHEDSLILEVSTHHEDEDSYRLTESF